MGASPLAGQRTGGRPRPEARVAVLASSTLVEDLLATASLRKDLGSELGTSPRAWAATAPELSLGIALPLRERVSLSGLVGWQPTQLHASDESGERTVQDLSIISALLSASFALRGPLLLEAGAGVLGYRSEERGIFAEGSDVSPQLRLAAGVRHGFAGHALTARALADVHRFGTPGIRAVGGSSGTVLRYGVQVGVVIGGAK